ETRTSSTSPVKYFPSVCGQFLLNAGAKLFRVPKVFESRDAGYMAGHCADLLDALKESAFITQAKSLCLAAVKDLNKDGKVAADGSGDEDGDSLSDYTESCVLGTDPCKKDTDGDGYSDHVDKYPLH